ncbi:MAG: MarR family transcriptional regulator [Alphaproteobacteria bacterium]|nr:MarR family transcriptional regulator [Alphaproteobacteria bacterium]
MDRSTALSLWKDVLADSVKTEGPDLSARQAAILMRIYLEPGPHTVRGLAGALNLGKPAVSRALDALTTLDFVRRRRDEQDLRNVLVQRTPQGAEYLSEFGDRICQCEQAIGQIPTGGFDMGEPARSAA